MSSLVPPKFMDKLHVSKVNEKWAQFPVIINIIAKLPAIIIAQHPYIIHSVVHNLLGGLTWLIHVVTHLHTRA